MSSAAPYERYKDALRRGHVAALRGKLEVALEAYEEAAVLAPDRALPLASRGTVLARQGRIADALASFEAALQRAPADEGALAGRADALAALGRRGDAALAFDALADAHDRAGRLTEACDAARRALELAESRVRRRYVLELADRLRASPLDDAARKALERAMTILVAEEPVLEPEPRPAAAADSADIAAADVDVAADAASAQEPAPPLDVAAIGRRAEASLDQGDTASARVAYLELAEAQRAEGHIDAALDAGYQALSLAPGNVDLHLELIALYLDRGWRAPAIEKLRLLHRLVDLGDEASAHDRLRVALDSEYAELAAEAGLAAVAG
jgi:tetratricopeptide (TPR) repeat protein